MKILTEDWTLSDASMDLLKLNKMTDEHIEASMAYFKEQFVGTSIDDIEKYDEWSHLFVMFCIKAARPSPLAPKQ